ncbi:MAG: hypothetical protein ACI9Z3_000388 [Roseivirga sp.]
MKKRKTSIDLLILSVLKRLLLFSLLLFVGFNGFAQRGGSISMNRDSMIARSNNRMLRDTITSVYGPKTTRYTYERNFKFNDLVFLTPDTIPDNLHRYTDIERNGNEGQNLGNLGTAYRSLYYEPSNIIGKKFGFDAYDEFYLAPEDIKYFDTKSPFTEINVRYGGGRRALTDVIFSLNDSIYLNLGFQYKGIRAEKQLSFLSTGEFQTKSTSYSGFGFIRPKKLPRYLALFNVTQMEHSIDEQGGIIDPEIDPTDSTYFSYRDANVVLFDAQSYDKRGGVHLYQQYSLDSVFQAYHTGNYLSQIVRFTDVYDLAGSDSLIYSLGGGGLRSDSINDRSIYQEITNEFGIKGQTKKFSYTLFYRLRNLKYDNVLLAGAIKDNESYVGGTLRQNITPKIFLKATGEYLIGQGYFIEGDFSSDFFKARVSRNSSAPSYLVQQYAGEQKDWNNSFSNEESDNLFAEIRLNSKRLSFRPFVRFNRISNYIYFDDTKRPNQASSDVVILAPGFNFDFNISKKWRWSSNFNYNTVSGGSSDTYRLPDLLITGQLAYKNVLFDGKMIVQTGVDLHYRSAYFANGYDPIVQQFYIQNDFENDAFVRADLFLNFKVQTFQFFVKSAHFNEGLTADGYFLTPYYTGVRRTLDLGVRWAFFD